MMQTIFRYTINTLYVLVILFVVVSLSFSAIVKKEELATQYDTTVISGQVVKQEIPVLADNSGSLHSVKITVGEHVTIGDALFEVTPSATTPDTNTSVDVIVAQTTGVVEKIIARPGTNISIDTPLAVILSDDNMKLAVSVSDSEYHQLTSQKRIYFYSQRLDQSFEVTPNILNPVEQGDDINKRTITAIYTFVNPEET